MTEKLAGGHCNYQGNGDMGSPLTQKRKKEMLGLNRETFLESRTEAT